MPLTSRKVSIQTKKKKTEPRILEESEFQHHQNYILVAIFGIRSMRRSRKYMFQQNDFRSIFVFYDQKNYEGEEN